jgi:hypothetical protein
VYAYNLPPRDLLRRSSIRVLGSKKKLQVCDRDRGLDIAEQSLRDVFNDVSKYIRNISMSLNALSP